MKRMIAAALALIGAAATTLLTTLPVSSQGTGWITLLDGKAKFFGDWERLGDANWRLEDDAVVADKKTEKDASHLVSKGSYKDFELRAEFWADDDCNSGIFIRIVDRKKVGTKTAYEVNIYDKRPGPEYGTGAIVDHAKVLPMPKAGGKWNVFEITAKGPRLTVTLNGQQTADVEDRTYPEGPISLQYGSGVIKWRKVEIKPL